MNDGRPTHLDLFAGIGGFALAARWAGFRTIGFCEIDKYCQQVITKNFHCYANGSDEPKLSINAKVAELPRISRNIRELDGKQFTGVALITGGFPCQPFSCAGKLRGKADDRHLWPEMLRVITEARPAWVLGENVAGIIGMELDAVLSDLETAGYACRPFVIPACGVDARHRRNRVWIVAHTSTERLEQYSERNGKSNRGEQSSRGNDAGRCGEDLPDANEGGFARRSEQDEGRCESERLERACRWQPEPNVGRVAHGIPRRVDRLRGLGNAIVPQVAYQIMRAIREQIENEKLQNPNPD